jgi:hypothetical protein
LCDIVYVRHTNQHNNRSSLALAHVSQQLHEEFFSFYHSHTTIHLAPYALPWYLEDHFPYQETNFRGKFIAEVATEPTKPWDDLLPALKVVNHSPNLNVRFAGPGDLEDVMSGAVAAARRTGWLDVVECDPGIQRIKVNWDLKVVWVSVHQHLEEERPRGKSNTALLKSMGFVDSRNWTVCVVLNSALESWDK